MRIRKVMMTSDSMIDQRNVLFRFTLKIVFSAFSIEAKT